MSDVIRDCIWQVERVINYWIDEGDLTGDEIEFVLMQVSNAYKPEDDENEGEKEKGEWGYDE